jgi:hypothetical protein|tara:strand:- start:155 stop:769 length:615 start_codon:yes stop_codon:yes gene_type:complete
MKILKILFLILGGIWVLIYISIGISAFLDVNVPKHESFLFLLVAILPPLVVYLIWRWISKRGIKILLTFFKKLEQIKKENKKKPEKDKFFGLYVGSKMASDLNKLKHKDIFWLAPIIVLVIAILPMPIGYYTLSRLVVCGSSIYFAYNFFNKKDVTRTWIFGFFVVLYNPIIPVYLYEKIIWVIVNIITIVVFYSNKDKIKEFK